VCKIGEDTTSPLEVPILVDEEKHGGDYLKPRTLLCKTKMKGIASQSQKRGCNMTKLKMGKE
jgi:hypothetical protein